MKIRVPFLLVFFAIVCFYAGNALYEAPRSAGFLVDSRTAGFVEKLKDYHAAASSFFSTGRLPEVRDNFPPAYQAESALLIHLFEKNWARMNLLHNGFYFALLLAGIFLLGKHVADETAGLAAMVVVALYPLSFAAFDKYLLDFPLMAIGTLCIYALLRSELFADRRWSVLFGLGCSYGMLMKEPFGAFMVGPALWGAYRAAQDVFRGKYARLANILVAGGIIAGILFLLTSYYQINVKWKVYHRLLQEPSGNPLWSFENIRLFTVGLWEDLLSVPFFLLLAAGIYPFMRRVNGDVRAVIALWVLVPSAILFLMPHWKTARYLLPELPAFALISAVMLSGLRSRFARAGIGIALIAVGITQYYVFKNADVMQYEFRFRGIRYFRISDDALSPSLARLRDLSGSLERTGAAVASVLKPRAAGRHTILFVPREGDWCGMQGLLGPYLWYAHDLDVQVLRAHSVYDSFITGNGALDAVDCVVYAIRPCDDPVPLGPALLRSNWTWVHETVFVGSSLDPHKAYDWRTVEAQWRDFIGSFRYHGVVSEDTNYAVHLYSRKGPRPLPAAGGGAG